MKPAFALDLNALSKELKLLLKLMQIDDGKMLNQDLKELCEHCDWEHFLQLSRHHRVYPILFAKMSALEKHLVPSYVMQRLTRDYRNNTFDMLRLCGEMESLHQSFLAKRIRFLVLKGPALAAELYGDISLRTSCDLDFLVSLDDLDQVEELLDELGYVKNDYIRSILNDWKWRHHHVTFLHPDKNIKIEVHWRLGPAPSKEPGFDKLWQRRKESTLSGSKLPMLGTEDSFLFLVSHGARHGWSRLRWLADIDRLARKELRWDVLKSLLAEHRMLHIGGQALWLASGLLGTPITKQMTPLSFTRKSWRLAQESMFYIRQMINLHTYPVPQDVNRYHRRHMFSLLAAEQKMLFVLSFMYPYYEDSQTLPLPKALHFLYFPLRPFLWLWRKVAASS